MGGGGLTNFLPQKRGGGGLLGGGNLFILFIRD